jgi:hypothetical protein
VPERTVSRVNVTVVPIAMMNPTSAHTGALCSERRPWSETRSSKTLQGKCHSGLMIAQNSAANRKP